MRLPAPRTPSAVRGRSGRPPMPGAAWRSTPSMHSPPTPPEAIRSTPRSRRRADACPRRAWAAGPRARAGRTAVHQRPRRARVRGRHRRRDPDAAPRSSHARRRPVQCPPGRRQPRRTPLVAIASHDDPSTLPVSAVTGRMFTDPNATAAWSRGLSPELLLDVSLKTFACLCSGESPRLNSEDEGWVVLPHGDVPLQHRARGRGDGVLARRADAPSRPAAHRRNARAGPVERHDAGTCPRRAGRDRSASAGRRTRVP